jgi:hypothetical protein
MRRRSNKSSGSNIHADVAALVALLVCTLLGLVWFAAFTGAM